MVRHSIQIHGQNFYHLYKLPMSNQYFWRTYTSKLMASFFQVAALTVRFGRLTEEYQGFKVKGYLNEEKKLQDLFSRKKLNIG